MVPKPEPLQNEALKLQLNGTIIDAVGKNQIEETKAVKFAHNKFLTKDKDPLM